MNTMKTKLLTTLFVSLLAVPAFAGKGGSNAAIVSAVSSGSTGSIIAEVERSEGLMCDACVQTVTALTEDDRYPVREVAGWWFAKRPALKAALVDGFTADLANGDSRRVRNAADFLGAVVELKALPSLRAVATRTGLSTDAKLAVVRAVQKLAHTGGDPVLVGMMRDSDPAVRAAAVTAWRDILGHTSATAVEPSLGDGAANVRAQAAAVIGAMKDVAAVSTLEHLVVSDADPTVRRNAAWALGKLGQASSRPALLQASTDKSGLVSQVAKAALATIP